MLARLIHARVAGSTPSGGHARGARLATRLSNGTAQAQWAPGQRRAREDSVGVQTFRVQSQPLECSHTTAEPLADTTAGRSLRKAGCLFPKSHSPPPAPGPTPEPRRLLPQWQACALWFGSSLDSF